MINVNIILVYFWEVILFLLPYLATVFLVYIGWKLWIHYIQQDFISGIEWVLLEIIPPRDVLRSPKAMELFLTNALYQWSMKGGREEYWQGAVWFWFSLEIASIDGQVHFFLRAPSRLKELIETQMYAQYPQAQVKVAEDYTLAIDKISPDSAWNGWGCEFKLEKPEVFSLKTYVDFGLDKDPKEEFKVDPISSVIELFGSIQKGEQMWMQIVITPSKKTYHTKSTYFGKHNWVEEGQIQLKKKLVPYTGSRARATGDKMGGSFSQEIRAPGFMDEMIKGSGRKLSKLGFDTGIRIYYVAKKEAFQMNSRRNLRLIFRQYANPFSNQLMRFNSTQADAYSGYFSATPKTVMILANRMLHEYRERSFFHEPLRHRLFSVHTIFWPFSILLHPFVHSETFVLNVEELATLWHFPGQILKVPTLERIESKEAAPPTDLPT
ncbi:MAG: hypothetical protein AAB493_00955 [Patescibacteria group bacterium]